MRKTYDNGDSSKEEEERLLPSNNNDEDCQLSINVTYNYRACDSIVRLNSYNREGKWPRTLWFMLTFLCLHWHRRIFKKRICYSCYVTSVTRRPPVGEMRGSRSLLLDPICLEYEYDGELWQNNIGETEQKSVGNDDEEVEKCKVCDVTWWNYHGESTHFTDESTGVSRWVWRGSSFISSVMLIIFTGCIIYDLSFYIDVMFGRQKKLLHLISYISFLMCYSTYPVLNICSKFRSFVGAKENVSSMSWASSLNAKFITKRMQFMNIAEKGLPGKCFFSICLIWPIFNAGYRIFIYFYILRRIKEQDNKHLDFHSYFSLWPIGILLTWWGCFIYLVYVMRLSFQRQFTLVLSYIRRHEGDLDNCRNCLSQAVIDFNCFRQLAVIYMGVLIPFTVLGITTNVSWQYRLSGACHNIVNENLEKNIDWLIWSTIIMFITLSVIALGGLDLNYIWDHFASSVVQAQTALHRTFWQKIFSHVRVMGGQHSVINLTLVWSVIGFYMGLHFGDDQDVYYNEVNCKETNVSQGIQTGEYFIY